MCTCCGPYGKDRSWVFAQVMAVVAFACSATPMLLFSYGWLGNAPAIALVLLHVAALVLFLIPLYSRVRDCTLQGMAGLATLLGFGMLFVALMDLRILSAVGGLCWILAGCCAGSFVHDGRHAALELEHDDAAELAAGSEDSVVVPAEAVPPEETPPPTGDPIQEKV